MSDLFQTGSAVFSECGNYRYALWRYWEEKKPLLMFVGLNPSTADETEDDQTIRRCVGFAMDWGYGGLCMGNLFAIRATKPKNMLIHLFREVWEKRTHSREVSPGWVGIC